MRRATNHWDEGLLTSSQSEGRQGLDPCLDAVESNSVFHPWSLSVDDINSQYLSSQQLLSKLPLKCHLVAPPALHIALISNSLTHRTWEIGMLMNVLIWLWFLYWTSMYTKGVGVCKHVCTHKQQTSIHGIVHRHAETCSCNGSQRV